MASLATSDLIKRIHAGIHASEARMQEFRDRRIAALKTFAGRHYGPSRSKSKAYPFNEIAQAAIVYVANLVARNPTFRVRAVKRQLRPYASSFEAALNHTVRSMGLRKELRKLVYDSVFSVAIAKCGISDGRVIRTTEGEIDVGEPFVERVSLDDYILDPTARDREEADFEGNRYRLRLDFVKENFKNTNLVTATQRAYSPREEAETLSQKNKVPANELEDYAELYDIWLPKEGRLLTLSVQELIDQPLAEIEWEGPEAGPYYTLGYHDVPDNALPLPPVALWTDLNEWINSCARKMKRQSERQKQVLAYEDRAAEDVARIVGTDDGETVKATQLDGIKSIEFGGTSPFQEGFVQWLAAMFSREAGNLDLVGGLASQSRTATEASQIAGQATIRFGDMQAQVYEFVRKLGENVAWYLFTDPAVEIPLTKRIQELGIEIDEVFTPEVREGEFPDFAISVEPYSMAAKDPVAYVRSLLQWWNAFVLPTLPIAMQQGTVPNMAKLWMLTGKEMNLDDVDELIQLGPMSADLMAEQGGAAELKMPNRMAGPERGPEQVSKAAYQVEQVSGEAQQRAPKPQALEMAGAQKPG